jgi:dolichyl-phosphate beta-glucosyltransferase
VPAFNEANSIAATLREMCTYFAAKPYDFEVIVVADGEDGTREVVAQLAREQPRLAVLGGPERRGKGRGVREGVRAARGDIIGFVDADNKTPITEFDRFEPHLAAGRDVVIGSRALRESRIERRQPWYRRIGSKGFAVVMHAILGLDTIVDTQCGFKFFRRDVAIDLFGRQIIDGYMFDVEILSLAARSGYSIVQIPVTWRDDHDSRLRLFRGNLRNMADLLRIRVRRNRPRTLPTPQGREDRL